MALSNTVQAAANPAPTQAVTNPAVSAPAAQAVTKGGVSKTNAFKSRGQSIRAQMSDADKAIEGSKSNTVIFKACLGDPARSQKRRENNQDVPSLKIVGYALELTEDTKVPHAPYKKGFKSQLDCEEVTWVDRKAGETVYLNNFETGIFISQPQYAGTFTGGEPVVMEIRFAQTRNEPLPILSKAAPSGSIKENLIEIATVTETENGKTYTPKEGFEDFANLWVKRSAAGGRGGSAAKKNESHKDLAAAFRNYLSQKA